MRMPSAALLFLGLLLPVLGCLPPVPELNDSGEPQNTQPLVLQSLSAGAFHTCGLTFDNRVTCWGRNENGQAAPPLPSMVAVSAGYAHSCGLRPKTNGILCWGDLGLRTGEKLPSGGSYQTLDVGWSHSCAVDFSNELECWGGTQSTSPLVEEQPDFPIEAVRTSGYHACALSNTGHLYCWGYNEHGAAVVPRNLNPLNSTTGDINPHPVMQFGTGRYHSCAIGQHNRIQCWGRNEFGESAAPQGRYAELSVGEFHNCALDMDGEMTCWGWNEHGQADAPEGVFLAVSAGENHTCALDENNVVQCWGDDSDGQASPPPPE